MGEPGRLPSMGSHRVWHNLAAAENNSFFALAGKGKHSGLIPLKIVCFNLGEFDEEFYSNSSKVGLLIRLKCVQGLHSFNLALGNLMSFCDSFILALNCFLWNEECWHLPLDGFQFCKEFKGIVVCIPWGGMRTLPQGYTIFWLLLPCLYIFSLPWLATIPIWFSELREGHGGWSLFPTNKEWRTCTAYMPRIHTETVRFLP